MLHGEEKKIASCFVMRKRCMEWAMRILYNKKFPMSARIREIQSTIQIFCWLAKPLFAWQKNRSSSGKLAGPKLLNFEQANIKRNETSGKETESEFRKIERAEKREKRRKSLRKSPWCRQTKMLVLCFSSLKSFFRIYTRVCIVHVSGKRTHWCEESQGKGRGGTYFPT